ncbi:MAG: DinB family protein [Planctomyces sp.]|nr:DinB family protein [Planctomyces sp.]
MQSKELLIMANQHAYTLTMPLTEDLRTASLVPPTPGGNHAHWVVGHLLFSEGRFQQIMKGGENPFEELQSYFRGQSTPRSDGSGYRAYGDLLSSLQSQHQTVISLLQTLTEDELDRPSQGCPPGFEPFFGTWRHVFLMRSMHWMIHRGQLADCRRAAGREPLLA